MYRPSDQVPTKPLSEDAELTRINILKIYITSHTNLVYLRIFFGGIILKLMNNFEEIIKLIDNARNNALKKVNEELITLYGR
jgi:hypothetical protein